MIRTGKEQWIIVCSDSVGDTAEAVVTAMLHQFKTSHVRIKRFSQMANEQQIQAVVEEARQRQTFIAYTLVQPILRDRLQKESMRAGVRIVDIMGPMMQAYEDTFNDSPLSEPGLLHRMDEHYFRRVEAVEFAVKHDDGKDASGILQAEMILIGVSRTSKTPLSIFLAHKGYKVANYPLIPEVKLPPEIFGISNKKIFGLTMDAEHMSNIRKERLKTMGLGQDAKYGTLSRVLQELAHADQVMKSLGCAIIDVSKRAIEETAGLILEIKQKQYKGE